jgi:prevent-host-death family protein
MRKAISREAERTESRSPEAAHETISVTATVVRTEFGRIVDLVAQGQRVIITRYGVATAVMVPVGPFDVPSAVDAALLDTLTAEFDACSKACGRRSLERRWIGRSMHPPKS